MLEENTNWQTKLNYSPRIRGGITLATFLLPAIALRSIDRGPVAALLPNILQGRLSDTASFGAELGFIKLLAGKDINNADLLGLTTAALVLVEIIQAIPGSEKTVFGGTFDFGDIGAIFVGAGLWGLYELAAKSLHDSGLTLMVYHALDIKHKKFD